MPPSALTAAEPGLDEAERRRACGGHSYLVASVFGCRLLTSALWLASLDRVNPR